MCWHLKLEYLKLFKRQKQLYYFHKNVLFFQYVIELLHCSIKITRDPFELGTLLTGDPFVLGTLLFWGPFWWGPFCVDPWARDPFAGDPRPFTIQIMYVCSIQEPQTFRAFIT